MKAENIFKMSKTDVLIHKLRPYALSVTCVIAILILSINWAGFTNKYAYMDCGDYYWAFDEHRSDYYTVTGLCLESGCKDKEFRVPSVVDGGKVFGIGEIMGEREMFKVLFRETYLEELFGCKEQLPGGGYRFFYNENKSQDESIETWVYTFVVGANVRYVYCDDLYYTYYSREKGEDIYLLRVHCVFLTEDGREIESING